ncbi:unnamed protein product [Lactuca saligna]|uniref:Uncharacterized protein n=1 Tax=Lactuca saligna TaxID=75948 RepID=A0AA35YVS2_LACSI|nr:unnamed protein product [Lactuca saligna]
MPNSRLQEGLPITPTLLKTFPPVYQTNEAGYFKNITKTKSDFYTNVVMTTLKSNSSWSSTSRRKNKEIIHPVYQTNKAGYFKNITKTKSDFYTNVKTQDERFVAALITRMKMVVVVISNGLMKKKKNLGLLRSNRTFNIAISNL